MKKMNNKGITIIEIVVTFSMIMFFAIGLLLIIGSYRNKVSVSLRKLELDTFKNNITQDVNNDLIKYRLKEINYSGDCATITGLNRCINFVFYDETNTKIEKAFGTSKVENNRDSAVNKYIYYDGIKYPIKDHEIPSSIPNGGKWKNFQVITMTDDGILDLSSVVLEDGTKVTIYRIDIPIYHLDFDEDFGIHIVATTDDVPEANYSEQP